MFRVEEDEKSDGYYKSGAAEVHGAWVEVRSNLWRRHSSEECSVSYHVCGMSCDNLRGGAAVCPISGMCGSQFTCKGPMFPNAVDSVSVSRRRRLDVAYVILSDFCSQLSVGKRERDRGTISAEGTSSTTSSSVLGVLCAYDVYTKLELDPPPHVLRELSERVLRLWEMHVGVGGFTESICDLAYIVSEGVSVCGGRLMYLPRNPLWMSLLPDRAEVHGRSLLRTRYLSSIRRGGFLKFSKWLSV